MVPPVGQNNKDLSPPNVPAQAPHTTHLQQDAQMVAVAAKVAAAVNLGRRTNQKRRITERA
jgi:hypothetical protein